MKKGRKYKRVQETRGWYYIDYHPPSVGNKYAVLNLTITEERPINEIVKAVETEAELWLSRYPVPIFATAWDYKEDQYDFSGIKPKNHLVGYVASDKKLRLQWGNVNEDEIPDLTLDQEYLDNLYSELDFKTYAELDAERQKRIKGIRTGSFLIFVWLVVIPLTFSVLEFSSDFLSAVVLLYSASKVIETWLELRGKFRKSKREIEKDKEERLKNHYYYHCQMNPEGFRRLELENFEKMAKDQIAKEAESLKRGKKLD
jgi:hypothetical protein